MRTCFYQSCSKLCAIALFHTVRLYMGSNQSSMYNIKTARVQVDRCAFDCVAETVTEPGRVADFLEYRRKHHPLMIGLMMKFAHKLPLHPSRAQFLELSKSTPLVILRPPS